MTFFKDTEVFLSRGIKLLMFLIPFIPLYVSSSLVFPYITGKNFAFRVLVEFSACLWLVLVFINRKTWFRNSLMLIAVMGFAFTVGLADLFGVNPYKSFWSNFERMEGYVTILHLLLYFILLKNMFKTKRDWELFFRLCLTVSVLVSVYALINDINGVTWYSWEYGGRARSTIGNPPFLAAYLLLSIFIGGILIINEGRLYLKFIFALAVLLNSAVIYSTATRGVILGGMAGIIVFISLYMLGRRKRDKKSIMKIVAIVTLLVFASVSIVLFVLNSTELTEQDSTLYRFKTIFSDHSVKSRLDVWKMSLPAIKERPLLGWGQENFTAVYTVNPIELQEEYLWLDRAHNIVIDWLFNAGFLGLLSYLLIFIAALYYVREGYRNNRINRTEASVVVTMLIAYFIQNLFLFDTINTYIIFFSLLAYIDNFELFEKPSAEKQEYNIDKKQMKVRFVCAVLTALLVFSVLSYYLNYKPIKQNMQAMKVSVLSNETIPSITADFKYLLSFNTFGNADVRERMLYISNYILIKKLFREEGALKFIQATSEELWKGIAFNRYNPEYYYELISYYTRIAGYEPSYIQLTEAVINESMRINPGFQWLYMAKADVCLLKKDYEGAYVNVKKIADMHPENDADLMKLALAAILVSREEIVKETLEKVKNIRIASNTKIASGKDPVFTVFELRLIARNYMMVNDLRQALHYYKEIIAMPEEHKQNRERPRLRVQNVMAVVHHEISEIYLALGETEKALEESEKATESGYKEVLGRENVSDGTAGVLNN